MNIIKIFKALGVVSINSQTFANGYYYEYSLESDEDGVYRVTRRLRNRYEFSNDEPATAVETPEQVEACKQALMYNFPHAFNIDGSVAIDLTENPAVDAEHDASAEVEETESEL